MSTLSETDKAVIPLCIAKVKLYLLACRILVCTCPVWTFYAAPSACGYVDNYVYNSRVLPKVVYRLIFPFCVSAHIYNAMSGGGPWWRWSDYLIDFAGY